MLSNFRTPGISLTDAVAQGKDNILPLRHFAAWLVIYSHSYDLTGHPGGQQELISRWLPGYKAGHFALYLFFAISGFLLMLSLMRRPDMGRYVRGRLLRIFPGYLVALVFCVFMLGPALTTLSAAEYFSHPETWQHVSKNLLPTSFSFTLPGLFASNPLPHAVNGSLWSLGLEMRWYGYLALLLAIGAITRRWLFSVIAGSFLAFAAYEWWFGKPDPYYFRVLSMVFVGAALTAQWKDLIRISGRWLACLAMATLIAMESRAFSPLLVTTTVYAVLWVSYRAPVIDWPANRDYSYGLFLYAFPVQQTIVALKPDIMPWAMCLLATLLTTALAWLSWHLVESPPLRLKK